MPTFLKLSIFLSIRKLADLIGYKKKRSSELQVLYCCDNKVNAEKIREIIDWYIPVDKQVTILEKGAAALKKQYDIILIGSQSLIFSKWFFSNPARSYIVDPNFYSFYEVANWLAASEFALKDKVIHKSKKLFKEISDNYKDSEVVLFGTGPGIARYNDFEWRSDQLKIICNSVIKNDAFLEKVKPQILVMADPLFHFGYSAYAKEFRSNLSRSWAKHKFYIVLPEEYAALMLAHYPEMIDHIIAMRGSNTLQTPDLNKLMVKKTENILTYLMLPLAYAMSSNINMIGFDGKANADDTEYFWEHESDFQFTEHMESAQQTHPSFFRDRNYPNYYKGHTTELDNYIDFGKKAGAKFQMLTKTYIPTLAEFYNEN